MPSAEPITVTSHVARDFLQNSAYFSTVQKVVWEYVANSLDAAKDGSQVVVVVEITSNFVTITDNGTGMSRAELSNFFRMHAENVQRQRGKRVRGRFGTGKCAAFGVANSLRIDTVQNGLRNVVLLERCDIEAARDGEPFPVRDIEVDVPTDEANGTIVTIKNLNIRKPNVDRTIKYLERHLGRYRQRARVAVNGQECDFHEPPSTQCLAVWPPKDVSAHIGDVELVIKVSPTPLAEELRGIDILSEGIWHGSTLAGLERKDRANQIFGLIDVPILESEEWAIPPFDNTRNNTLNLQNPVVAVLIGWIAEELENVRLGLVEQDRVRRETEAARRLSEEAKRIAELLNEDFAEQEFELAVRRSVAMRSGEQATNEVSDEAGDPWPGEGGEASPWQQTGSPHGGGSRGQEAGAGDTPRPGPTVSPGSEPGARKRAASGTRKRRRAVFSIDFEDATSSNPRSRYDVDSKTIHINMDHRQIAGAYAAGGRRTEDRAFREMCYEVAAVEYAMVLPRERLADGEQFEADEILYEIRRAVNRVTRRFAAALET